MALDDGCVLDDGCAWAPLGSPGCSGVAVGRRDGLVTAPDVAARPGQSSADPPTEEADPAGIVT